MVDYMTRTLRAAITNEVPNGEPFRLPQGVLGPEVLLDARSSAEGRDPQLERAVQEALRLVEEQGTQAVTPPPYPRPSRRPGGK